MEGGGRSPGRGRPSVKARRVKKLDPTRAARRQRGPDRPGPPRRAALVRAHAPCEPSASRAQHDMRIAAKRLRYVLEATEFCFGRPAQVARRRARDLQDAARRAARLRRDAAPRRATSGRAARGGRATRSASGPAMRPTSTRSWPRTRRHRTSYRGLETLIVYLQARRALLFDRFRRFWAEQERAGTWDRLERAAERVLGEARERRRAAKRAARAARELADAERRRARRRSRPRGPAPPSRRLSGWCRASRSADDASATGGRQASSRPESGRSQGDARPGQPRGVTGPRRE